MKTITDIKPQVKDKERVNVYLDNSFYCGLELITVMTYRLKIGMEIDEKRLGEIQLESERNVAMDKALNFISGSMKTLKDVKKKLKDKGYTDEVITAVTDKLKEYGYVDDLAYAKSYVASYSKSKGKRLMERDLFQKGICQEYIDEALSELTEETEVEQATLIAQKYMRNKIIDVTNLQKCFRYLTGKGFSPDVIKSVLEGMKQDEDF